MAAASPLAFWVMERVSPSHVGRGGFAPVMRLATAIGLIGGLHVVYQRSCSQCNHGAVVLIYALVILTFLCRPLLWLHGEFEGS